MAAALVENGVALIDTQADWAACVATPAEAVDTTTTVGSIQLAAGYNSAVIVTPIFQFVPWTRWMFLTLAGSRAEKTAYFIRFRTATTEAGIANATWTPYLDSIAADGSIGMNLRSWCKNNEEWAVGPFLQVELTIER